MTKQHLMLALLGTTLLAGPALAQSMNNNQSSGSTSTPSATTSTPATSAPSSASASSSGGAQFMSQAQTGQWRASKLVGVDIYGSNNEKIGDVNEILIDKNGQPQAVVIGVGGFLGVGSKDVAVQWSAIQWKDTPRASSSASSSSSSGTTSTSGANTSGSSSASSSPKVLDYPDHGELSMTKEQLQNAPTFKYASDTSSDSGNTTRAPSGPAGGTTR